MSNRWAMHPKSLKNEKSRWVRNHEINPAGSRNLGMNPGGSRNHGTGLGGIGKSPISRVCTGRDTDSTGLVWAGTGFSKFHRITGLSHIPWMDFPRKARFILLVSFISFLFFIYFFLLLYPFFFSLSVYRGNWRMYVVAPHYTTAVYLLQRSCLCRSFVITELVYL